LTKVNKNDVNIIAFIVVALVVFAAPAFCAPEPPDCISVANTGLNGGLSAPLPQNKKTYEIKLTDGSVVTVQYHSCYLLFGGDWVQCYDNSGGTYKAQFISFREIVSTATPLP